VAPNGVPVPTVVPHIDSTLIKAIARAFRWQRMLEIGGYVTIPARLLHEVDAVHQIDGRWRIT